LQLRAGPHGLFLDAIPHPYIQENTMQLNPSEALNRLAAAEGYDDPLELLEDAIFDSLVPAICLNAECGYTQDLEPDLTGGWCENCQAATMASALVLANLI